MNLCKSMTHISRQDRKKSRHARRAPAQAGNAPVSSPAGRAYVLRVAYPATVVAALATGELFRIYDAIKAQAASIDALSLPLSPPDPTPALAYGISAACVTLLLAAATWEVASGKSIAELPRLAVGRLANLVKSASGVACASGSGAKASAAAAAGRGGFFD